MQWSKVLTVLRALYVALLKGKTVRIGGQDVTFPQHGHGPDIPNRTKDSIR